MNQRLGFIDVLRGFAALFVICFHTTLIPHPNLPYPVVIHNIIDLGWSGVTLFFIISAFTMCLTLDNRTTESNWILKFYFRRAGRILPLYYFWLIIMAIYTYGGGIFHVKGPILSFMFFTYNFRPGMQEGLVWASWTLGVEMVFYLIFPWIFITFNNLKKAIGLFAITLLLSYIHFQLTKNIPDYIVGMGFLSHLPVFALGIITYWVYKNYIPVVTRKSKMAVLFISGFVILFALSSGLRNISPSIVTYILALAYSSLLLGFSLIPDNLLVTKFTVFLGTISYSLYLNHPRTVKFLVPSYRWVYEIKMPAFLKMPACFLITIIPLIGLSYLTYLLIEKPGARLVKHISNAIFKKSKSSRELIQISSR